MLTSSEKRFVRSWEEQRKGGRWSYLLLYILAGTFISTIVIFFVLSMFSLDFDTKIWSIPVASFLIVTVITTVSWSTNEKKFKTIIRREVNNGKDIDGLKN